MTDNNKDFALNWEDNLEKLRQERAKHTQDKLKPDQPNQTIVQFEEAFEEATGEKERLLQESNPFNHSIDDDLLDNPPYDELLNIDIIGGEDSDFLKEVDAPSEVENNVFFHSLENLGNANQVVAGSIDSFMPFDLVEDNQTALANTKPQATLPLKNEVSSAPSQTTPISVSSNRSAIQVDNNGPVVKANVSLEKNLENRSSVPTEKIVEHNSVIHNEMIKPTVVSQDPPASPEAETQQAVASHDIAPKLEKPQHTQSLPKELEIVDEINILPLPISTESTIAETEIITPQAESIPLSLATEDNQTEQAGLNTQITNKPEQTIMKDVVIQVSPQQSKSINQTTGTIKEPLSLQEPIELVEEISIEDIKSTVVIEPQKEDGAQQKPTTLSSHQSVNTPAITDKIDIKTVPIEDNKPTPETKHTEEKIPELNLAIPQNKANHPDITAEIVTQKPVSLVGEHQLIESVVQQLSVSIHETVMDFVKNELDKQTEQMTQIISKQLPSILADLLQKEVKTAIEKTKQQLK